MRTRFLVASVAAFLITLTSSVVLPKVLAKSTDRMLPVPSIDESDACTIQKTAIAEKWKIFSEPTTSAQLQYQARKDNSSLGCLGVDIKDAKTPAVSIQKYVNDITPGTRYIVSQTYRTDVPITFYVEAFKVDDTSQTIPLMSAPSTRGAWSLMTTRFTVPADTSYLMFHVEIETKGKLSVGELRTIETKAKTNFSQPMVSITFDDGWKSNYSDSAKALGQLGVPATFFVNYGTLNTNKYMTTNDVLDLSRRGFDIESHGYYHDDLLTVDSKRLAYDLQQNKRDLEHLIGKPVRHFATPYSSYTSLLEQLILTEYDSHRIDSSLINYGDNRMPQHIHAQGINSSTSLSDLTAWLKATKDNNGWLVLTYHGVDGATDEYTISPEKFREQIKAIKDSGIQIANYDQAYKTLIAR